MFGLGTQELLIILFIAFLLFGAKRLPEIGAGLGKGIRSFKQALRETEVSEEVENLQKTEGVKTQTTQAQA